MNTYSHPNPEYKPDCMNNFVVNSKLRSFIRIFEFLRFLLGACITLAVLFFLILAGVIFKWGIITYSIGALLLLGCGGYLVSKISLFKTVPLKCSQCHRHMKRWHRPLPAGTAVFYECSFCKLYIDTGCEEGD